MENFGFSNVPVEPDVLSGYFDGLFPTIKTENSIINHYEEIYQPSEPVLKDSMTHTFYIPRKPTNTWTALSQSMLNCGFTFEKKTDNPNGEITWEAVNFRDKAVPCSGLLQAFWSDVDIRLNQTRVTKYGDRLNCYIKHVQFLPFLGSIKTKPKQFNYISMATKTSTLTAITK